MPVRDFRWRTPPVALCRAHRRNGAQPDQSGRCAARTGIDQLAETDLDVLRTLRGVYLRRSLLSVEDSGCNARTKRMTKETLMSPEFDKRIPAALLILRFFLATFLLQWSIEKLILPDAAARIASNFYAVTLPAAGSYALGVAELIVSLALLVGFYRTISYGLSLLIHTVTVVVSWRQLFDPWGLVKVGSHLCQNCDGHHSGIVGDAILLARVIKRGAVSCSLDLTPACKWPLRSPASDSAM